MNSSDLTKMEGLSGMHLRKALRVCDQVTDLNTTTSLRLQIANLLNELGEKTQAVQLLTSIWTVLRTRLDAGESLSSIEDALQTALDSGKSLDSLSTSGVKLFGGIIDLARDLDQIKLMQETFDYAKEYINLHRSNFELYDPDLLIAELVAKSGRPDEALQLVKGYLGIVSADGVYRAIFDVFLANGEFDKAYEIIKSCDSWNWVALLVDLAKADARFYAEAEEYLNSSYTENLEMVEHHKDTVVRIPKSLLGAAKKGDQTNHHPMAMLSSSSGVFLTWDVENGIKLAKVAVEMGERYKGLAGLKKAATMANKIPDPATKAELIALIAKSYKDLGEVFEGHDLLNEHLEKFRDSQLRFNDSANLREGLLNKQHLGLFQAMIHIMFAYRAINDEKRAIAANIFANNFLKDLRKAKREILSKAEFEALEPKYLRLANKVAVKTGDSARRSFQETLEKLEPEDQLEVLLWLIQRWYPK